MAHKSKTWGKGTPAVITIDEARLRDTRQVEGDWLNPISMNELQKAVTKGDESVHLNGILYNIKYQETTIYLKRDDGQYAPCGYVSLAAIRNFRFDA